MTLQRFYQVVGFAFVWFSLGLTLILGTIGALGGFKIAYGF